VARLSLSAALRTAVASGDWEAARGRFRDDAVMRTSYERGRLRLDGRDAVIAQLSGPGPGEVLVWEGREWPSGVAVTFEWRGATVVDRRRWYVRADRDGLIAELWSSSAQPAGEEAGVAAVPTALLEELGVENVEPLVHGGNSGAALLRASRPDGESFVLKRVRSGADWLARATRDEGRTAQLYEAGAFDAMPPVIEHGIVAVARDGDAAWVAMRDVAVHLLPEDAPLTRADSRRILTAAAALHAAFAGAVPAGAAALADRLGMASAAVSEAERNSSDLLPKQFEHAWEAFADVVPGDVAGPVLAYVANPGALADALVGAAGATTLIHGDLRDDNLGFAGDRLVLIDWDLATAGTPTVDFAWYLAQDAWRIEASHDEIEADYRALYGSVLNDDEVELGLISGLVQYGWLIAHSARVHPDPEETAWGRAELDWWVPRVRRALERVGPA
jgi:hypothetical protein